MFDLSSIEWNTNNSAINVWIVYIQYYFCIVFLICSITVILRHTPSICKKNLIFSICFCFNWLDLLFHSSFTVRIIGYWMITQYFLYYSYVKAIKTTMHWQIEEKLWACRIECANKLFTRILPINLQLQANGYYSVVLMNFIKYFLFSPIFSACLMMFSLFETIIKSCQYKENT